MKSVVSAAIVAALVIVSAALASRPSSEGRPVPVVSTTTAKAKAAAARRACARARPSLRRGIVERRGATWRWQDRLDLARTETRHPERRLGCGYLAWARKTWALRAHRHWRLYASLADPDAAIEFVFGPYADEAKSVAACESGDDDGDLSPHVVWAENGQYLGMFQMGSSERRIFGHGTTPLEQARAAHRYFVASGRDWSPWQCRPGGVLGW